jgi:hypothetical protein
MDEKLSTEEREQHEEKAIQIGKEKGFDAALAYLIKAGYDEKTTPEYLGFLLGTWEHITRDENGKIVMIRN